MKSQPAKKRSSDQRARRAEGFLAQHRVEYRATRVLLGPDASDAAGTELVDLPNLPGRLALGAFKPELRDVLVGELAGVVELLMAGRRVVRVGVADDSVLERIAGADCLVGHAVEQGLAQEAALALRRTLEIGGQGVVPLLEGRELVVRRELRMCLRGALDLADLVQRLVLRAGGVVSGIERLPVELHQLEHAPVAGIAIVRDREQRRAGAALQFHPPPERLGIVARLVDRQRQLRQLRGVAKHDDAMQVPLVRVRGPLEAGESREPSGLVGRIGGLDHVRPGAAADGWIGQRRIGVAGADVAQDLGERLQRGVRVLGEHTRGDRQLADRGTRHRHLPEHAEHLGVVGDHVEIERSLELYRRAVAAASHCSALRPSVGIGGRRA